MSHYKTWKIYYETRIENNKLTNKDLLKQMMLHFPHFSSLHLV